MTYKKPENITYTQMAMWIDENASKHDCNQATLYEYLYLLSYMIAKKRSYFAKAASYDEFCLHCANFYTMRLLMCNESNRVHYILKYIKDTIKFRKIEYQRNTYGETPTEVTLTTIDNPVYINTLVDDSSPLDMIEFAVSLESIDTIVRNYLKKIPHKVNSPEWTNIYLSCLMTLLDNITLTKSQETDRNSMSDMSAVYRIYDDTRKSPPKLFHLDASMESYIRVLVNEIRSVISTELSWKTHTHYNADAVMQGVIASEMEI